MIVPVVKVASIPIDFSEFPFTLFRKGFPSRIYAPRGTLSQPALRRFFWKESYGEGKGVIRILDKRHSFVFSITFARNAVRASEPQGEPDQTAFLNHPLMLFSS